MDPMFEALEFFKAELQMNGCLEDPNIVGFPTLTNDIHPLFRVERWMRGYDQITEHIYHRMEPAMRLASLLITEEFMLPWWNHVSYAHRRQDHRSRGLRVYLAPSDHEHTAEGKQQTVRRLRRMAYTTTYMFTPHKYEVQQTLKQGFAWGITYLRARDTGFSHHYGGEDWPHLGEGSPYEGKQRPIVTMNYDFQVFFGNYFEQASLCEKYRVWFMFAVTLVHETAHAYYFWLSRKETKFSLDEEPLWSKYEERPELGWSWEGFAFGRQIEPHNHSICGMGALMDMYTEDWNYGGRSKKHADDLVNTEGMQWVELPIAGLDFSLLQNWKGVQWGYVDTSDPRKNFQLVCHVFPMKWVVDWFRKTWWRQKRDEYAQRRYRAPPLGPTFVLFFERRDGEIRCFHGYKDEDPYWANLQDQQAEMNLYGWY